MKLPLALALLFLVIPGLADDAPASENNAHAASAVVEKAHPDLLRLEKALTSKQEDKKEGRIKTEQYQEWEANFRTFLAAMMARVPQSSGNTAVHARIMTLLGDGGQAQATLDRALEQNPESPILLRTKGQMLYGQKDYPGAAQHGLLAWEKSGHSDRAALTLYHMAKDRSGLSDVTPSPPPGTSPQAQAPATVLTDDTSKPYKLAVKGRAKLDDVPVPGLDETTPGRRRVPLWPLALSITAPLVAYGLYRGARKQEDGGIEPTPDKNDAPESALIAPVVPGALLESSKGAGVALRGTSGAVTGGTLGDIAIGGAVGVGIIVALGGGLIVTVNRGLNEMIAAQDKYNEAIDTRKLKQDKFDALDKEAAESRAGAPLVPPVTQSNPEQEKQNEYEAYKTRCQETALPGLDICAELLWILRRDKDCVRMREEWDRKWSGDHKGEIESRKRAIVNVKKKLRRNDCPEVPDDE